MEKFKKIINNKLLVAVSINDIIEVKDLLKSGADVNTASTVDKGATFKYGLLKSFTPLILAAKEGYSEIVQELLRSPDINVNKNNYGISALHVACEEGHAKVVKLLLAFKGTDINVIKSDYSFSRVKSECDKNQAEEAKTLSNIPGSMSDKTDGWTPLHIAVEKNQTEIVEALLNHPNIDVSIQDRLYGYTPLHLAENHGYSAILKRLLTHPKMNVNVKDKSGRTALQLAMQNEHELCVQILQNIPFPAGTG